MLSRNLADGPTKSNVKPSSLPHLNLPSSPNIVHNESPLHEFASPEIAHKSKTHAIAPKPNHQCCFVSAFVVVLALKLTPVEVTSAYSVATRSPPPWPTTEAAVTSQAAALLNRTTKSTQELVTPQESSETVRRRLDILLYLSTAALATLPEGDCDSPPHLDRQKSRCCFVSSPLWSCYVIASA